MSVHDHLTLSKYLSITRDAGFLTLDWKERAACVAAVQNHPDQYDSMDWFPTQRGHSRHYIPPSVKAVCNECPVRLQCLTLALYTNEPTGIWGGQSTPARQKMRRKIQNALRKTGEKQ